MPASPLRNSQNKGNYFYALKMHILRESFRSSLKESTVQWVKLHSQNIGNANFTLGGSSQVRPCTEAANECIKQGSDTW